MKKLFNAKSDISSIKAATSQTLHKFVRKGKTFTDSVTGLEFPIVDHVRLPVSHLNQLRSRLVITFTVGTALSNTNFVEAFRIGDELNPSVVVELRYVNTSIILVSFRYYKNGIRSNTTVPILSLALSENMVIVLDPNTWGILAKSDYTATTGVARQTSSTIGPISTENDKWDPGTVSGYLTTEFSATDCNIISVEEILIQIPATSHGDITGQTPDVQPLAVHTKADAQSLQLNTWFENGELKSEGPGFAHTSSVVDGSIYIDEEQEATITVDADTKSVRFISLPQYGQAPWFRVSNDSFVHEIHLASDGRVTLDGQPVGRVQPYTVHCVWLVIDDQTVDVFCDGQPLCSIRVTDVDTITLLPTAGRVTGAQKFTSDVRLRSIFNNNGVTSVRPWHTTHCHLVEHGGYMYDVHNFFGSEVRTDADYIGETMIGGRTAANLNSGITRDIQIPFRASGELVGLVMRVNVTSQPTYPPVFAFRLNGINYQLRITISSTKVILAVYQGSGRLNAVSRGITGTGSALDYPIISLQVAKGKMQVLAMGVVLDVAVPYSSYYAIENVDFLQLNDRLVHSLIVHELLGYTAKRDTFGMIPNTETTPTRNLWKQDGRTVFELSGNDLCELVSDTPFDFPLSDWILGGVRGNYHRVTVLDTPMIVPCAFARLDQFTLYMQIQPFFIGPWENTHSTSFDLGQIKVTNYRDSEWSGLKLQVGSAELELPSMEHPDNAYWELVLEYDGSAVKAYINGEEAASAQLSGTVAGSEALTIWSTDENTSRMGVTFGAFRILNEACAAELIGKGYSAPYSLVESNSSTEGE